MWTNLGDLIRTDADSGKTAIIDLSHADAPRHFTFRDLDLYANGVARGLIQRGLKRRSGTKRFATGLFFHQNLPIIDQVIS